MSEFFFSLFLLLWGGKKTCSLVFIFFSLFFRPGTSDYAPFPFLSSDVICAPFCFYETLSSERERRERDNVDASFFRR